MAFRIKKVFSDNHGDETIFKFQIFQKFIWPRSFALISYLNYAIEFKK